MRCIEIWVNGRLLCRAGIAGADTIAPSLHGAVAGDAPARLRVAGMYELGEGRAAHVCWCKEHPLAAGDTVAFAFVESDSPSPPVEIGPTDTPEYREEQRAELDKTPVPDQPPMPRQYPGLSFECRLDGRPPVVAASVADEEHIVCDLDWDKWRPHVCQVSVRSFGGKLSPREKKSTDWVRDKLALGETLEVRVAV